MKFEIDMLNVGNADAMTIRYWGEDNQEVVILIDAGKPEHGPTVEQHILKHTEQQKINLAICTHSDDDHIGGFNYLLDCGIEIDEFWMHDPASYRERISLSNNYNPPKEQSIDESIRQALALRTQLNNTIITLQPFAGLTYDRAPIRILAPTDDYYLTRLKRFRDINNLFEVHGALTNPQMKALTGIDPSKTNNTSVITYFHPGKFKYLFTADADATSLDAACQIEDLSNLDWLQIPHHGSKYNINSKLARHFNPKTAYISAAGKEMKPHPDVIKLFKNETRTEIFSTEGRSLLRKFNTQSRPGFRKASPNY